MLSWRGGWHERAAADVTEAELALLQSLWDFRAGDDPATG